MKLCHNYSMKKISLLLLLFMTLFAQTRLEPIQAQKAAFEEYKQTQLSGLQKYKLAQEKTYEDYKKGIASFWVKPKMSTKKKWLSYSEDKKSRSDVDFEKGTITVEAIAKTPEEAKQKLQVALAKAVTIDTKRVQESDPLEKKLSQIQKPQELAIAKVNAEPILSTVIFKKKPTKKSVARYVNKHINKQTIKVLPSKKIKDAFVYKVKVKMPKGALYKRSHIYFSEIKKQSNRQGIPTELTFAIMHTESYFNPRARSHIPAFGLMQIVPKSAGIDAYFYLYNRKKLVSGSYLYNSTNNIKMGTAYLHLLYYRYLRKIKNPQSRLYCTNAAYNTGAGNIAYAFTKHYNMSKAAPIINSLTPDEVYAKLQKDLRWNEPKVYLRNVRKRMKTYHKLYTS
jgi:membrane-bound lytic murein transglycosylase C